MEIIKKNRFLKNLIVVLLCIIGVLVYWQFDGERRLQLFAIQNSPMNTSEFLDVFTVDSQAACVEKENLKNKYGIPEDECIRIIKANSNSCKKKAIEKFSGKVNTIERMLLVGNFFTTCVFTKKD